MGCEMQEDFLRPNNSGADCDHAARAIPEKSLQLANNIGLNNFQDGHPAQTGDS
jgi:hypothetical protein